MLLLPAWEAGGSSIAGTPLLPFVVASEDTGCDDEPEVAAAEPGRGLRRVVWCMLLECWYGKVSSGRIYHGALRVSTAAVSLTPSFGRLVIAVRSSLKIGTAAEKYKLT